MSIRSLRAFPLLTLALLALPPAAGAAGACRYVPVATLQLRGSGPIWQPTVDGTINGNPAVMLADTGAYSSKLVKSWAEKYKVPLSQSGSYSMGIGGASVDYVARIDDISVGDAHSGKTTMAVLGNMGKQPAFDAILGANFLLQADLEISLAERKLKFYRAKDCQDTYLAYWNSEAMEIPFGGTETGHLDPRLIVEINGTRMEAIIDTGASATSMTRAAAERAGIKVGDANVDRLGSSTGVGDARIDTWQTEVDTLTIGSETIRNASINIRDNPPQGTTVGMPEVLLGADFLRAHRVLIAMSQRRFYVTYNGGEVFPKRRPNVSQPLKSLQ
jgi:predicted aspartyl protease